MDISNNTGVKSLFGISLIAALAGFIFGFDTVVISGANLPIKELWHTTPLFHGFFIMSMALWGTVLGSILEVFLQKNMAGKKSCFGLGFCSVCLPLVRHSHKIPILFHCSGSWAALALVYPRLLRQPISPRFQHQLPGVDWWPCTNSILFSAS